MKPSSLLQSTFAVAAILSILGCAGTPEPSFTNKPGDFKVTKIQSDLFDIRYTGEAYTTMEKAKGIAGQRIATLCLNEGYRYFIVVNSESGWVERPAQAGYAPEHSAAQPHQVPYVKGQIRFFKKDPKIAAAAVYNAQEVEQNLAIF